MTTLTPTSPPVIVARKLEGLRVRMYLWLGLDGASVLVLALFALMALSVGADRLGTMDRYQRAICLFLAAAATTLIVYRRIARPLCRRVDDDTLCLKVEAAHRRLGQGLISAVQFSRLPDPEALGLSSALVHAAIDQGVAAAAPLAFAEALGRGFRRRSLTRGGFALLALLLVGAVFAAPASGSFMRLWLRRNVLLSNDDWPRRTHIRLKGLAGNTIAHPRGDDFEPVVEITGVIPETVTLHISPETGRREARPMKQIGGIRPAQAPATLPAPQPSQDSAIPAADAATFAGSYPAVWQPFRFSVSAGDAQTPWLHVILVERPRAEELTLEYLPPAYTGLPAMRLPPGEGSHEVLKGGTLRLRGRANKPLKGAELYVGDRPLLVLATGADVAGIAAAATAPAGSADTATPTATPSPFAFAGRVEPSQLTSGSYAVILTDHDGLSTKRPTRFGLKVVSDRKPLVRANLQGISGLATARARIPILARVTDDYGVVGAGLEYLRTGAAGEKTDPKVIPFTLSPDQLGKRALTVPYAFELEPLNLVVGMQLSFRVEARDADNVSGPNVGQSSAFFVKIASDDEVRSELLRREQEQRQEFERLLKDQEDILTDTRATLLAVKAQPKLPEADRQTLVRAEKRQRLAKDRCEAIAEQFAAIHLEVTNNRLEEEDGPVQRRLRNSIIEPLRGLAKQQVPRAADQLDLARKASTEAADRNQALESAVAAQKDAVDRMREILKYMVKWEGYQEAVNLLHEILKAQGDVSQATAKELERAIEASIFGGGAGPATQPKR